MPIPPRPDPDATAMLDALAASSLHSTLATGSSGVSAAASTDGVPAAAREPLTVLRGAIDSATFSAEALELLRRDGEGCAEET